MTELLTAAQMRAIEQAAIDSGEVTGLELMERAGRGVVDAIFEEWPELQATSHRAVVLCGPGNNGGDGFVVARLLKEWGWEVEVFLYGDSDKLPPDARVNYERWGALGAVEDMASADLYSRFVAGLDLIVDAVFGIGLRRGFEIPMNVDATFHTLMEDGLWWGGALQKPYVVAIDIVSELEADSGKYLEASVDAGGAQMGAHLTVTFHRPKPGHYLGGSTIKSGKLSVIDIGLTQEIDPNAHNPYLADNTIARLVTAPEREVWREWIGKDFLHPDSNVHKYAHGHALILTGGPGKTGAARLSARGALRIGAGLVTLACPPNTLGEVAAHVTALMCRPLDGAPGLREMLEDERLNALCLGPGMGLGADTQALVIEALKSKRSIVLDADALTRFERNPQTLFDLCHENTVLTPHAGEFKRLFPDIAEKLNAPATKGPAYSKVHATREAAVRAGCTVLFKGPDTVIADQTGHCSINSSAYERAAPWLATAGSGDVLAGFITGLLARGFGPRQASETAAWLHTECALSFGPGLIAEDLPEELPKVFHRLLAADG
ncbi:MAG: NAD(P)H-hydrate dehydratase [Pseudomonadota bacterium]